MRRWCAALAFLALIAGVGVAASAPGGMLDPSFEGDGKVVRDFGAADDVRGVAVQPDGKIVAVGASGSVMGDGHFAVVRLERSGIPDTAFSGGRVITEIAAWSAASAVGLQRDGKIVVAGYAAHLPVSSGNADFALARYNPDGTLDRSFGGGIVLTDIRGHETISAVVVQDDGKIVAAGGTARPRTVPSEDLALARYNPDGSLDTSFGGGGTVFTDFGGIEVAADIALQADGKIVVAGGGGLVRYNAYGTLDTSFGFGGRVVSEFPPSALAIQPDGKIVAALGRSGDLPVARYLSDGRPDPAFAPSAALPGLLPVDIGGIASDLALQANGKILVLGNTAAGGDFVIARFLPSGIVDARFGQRGKAFTDLGGDDSAESVALAPDGKVVAAGWTRRDTTARDGDIALARYLPGTCSVPRLRGITRATASARLVAANCRLGRVRTAFAKGVRKGRIASQTPSAGRQATDWALVNVVVSRGAKR